MHVIIYVHPGNVAALASALINSLPSRHLTRGCCAVLCYKSMDHYWAIRAGLLTPLTFARHRLRPLAAFTSGAYFLHNGKR